MTTTPPRDPQSILRQLLDAAENTAVRIEHLHYFAARDLADAVTRAKAQLREWEAAEMDRREAARPLPDGGHVPHREPEWWLQD